MARLYKILPLFLLSLTGPVTLTYSQELSLAGTWMIRMDSANLGLQQRWFDSVLTQPVRLPGSCEQMGYGQPSRLADKDRLTRAIRYEGKIWYQRAIEVPASWKGKRLELFLERCHLESSVWLDGKPLGTQNSLSTPHVYELGLTPPGFHRLTICIDNTYKIAIGRWGFAITDDTQGNWNGIIGKIALRATDPLWIREVQVYEDHLQVRIGNLTGRSQSARLDRIRVRIPVAGLLTDMAYHSHGARWDEFAPVTASHTLRLAAGIYADSLTVHYGLRDLATRGGQFTLNGRPVQMRGPVNECVYPLTGYPPMDKPSWLRVLNICLSYGFNFMRFNSWCPPEAAFEAADQLGMFLQVELPFWSIDAPVYGEDPARDQFLQEELYHILDQYGNHPSFAFLAMGNESPGPLDILVNKARARDGRHLYRCADGDTLSHGDYAERGTEIGQRGFPGPRTDWNRWTLTADSLTSRYAHSPMPTMGHEVGQWASYPDFDQIPKFTGTLRPYNYERFRQSLSDHHMAAMNKAFARASGALALELYKEEIEGCLRTFPLGGFQIVEARDFPGEGGAMIGWLDAFWDSKGLITPEAFRRFCGPVVCLLRMPKRIYTNEETFQARAEVSNFGPAGLHEAVDWKMEDSEGKLWYRGSFPARHIPSGTLIATGEISVPLHDITQPTRMVVTVRAGASSNSWNIWVYPARLPAGPSGVRVAYSFDENTRQALQKGESVVLFSAPDSGLFNIQPGFMPAADQRFFHPVQKGQNALPGSFTPAFWNMRLFNQIGTLGILCDPGHPALSGFPTQSHSDWQWADILGRFTATGSYQTAGDMTPHAWGDVFNRSKAIILDEAPAGYLPIVQVIDNYERNDKLGLIFETRVGRGRLLVCAADLDRGSAGRPAARQLKASLLRYAASGQFNPAWELPLTLLEKILE